MPGYSIYHLLILIVVLAACIALVVVALRQFGIAVPEWAKNVCWIVVVAAVIIVAIRFVMSL